MKKILTVSQAIQRSNKLRREGKSIVLAGGCFDILHVGHITFLEEAKKHGDVLMVMLESDETVQQLKGDERPINTQQERAKILEAIYAIDYIILLPKDMNNKIYDGFVLQIKPAIIATTEGDPYKSHKDRQAKKAGATVVEVKRIENVSTSKLANILNKRGLL